MVHFGCGFVVSKMDHFGCGFVNKTTTEPQQSFLFFLETHYAVNTIRKFFVKYFL